MTTRLTPEEVERARAYRNRTGCLVREAMEAVRNGADRSALPAPAPAPASPEAPAPDLDEARLAYANACERMGMAHANGTRREWEEAAADEVTTRSALMAALSRALSEAREAGRREALLDAANKLEAEEDDARTWGTFRSPSWVRLRALASTTRGDAPRAALSAPAPEDRRDD